MRWSDWLVLIATGLSFASAMWIVTWGEKTRRRTNNLRDQMIDLINQRANWADRCVHGELVAKPCPQCGDIPPEEKRRL